MIVNTFKEIAETFNLVLSRLLKGEIGPQLRFDLKSQQPLKKYLQNIPPENFLGGKR